MKRFFLITLPTFALATACSSSSPEAQTADASTDASHDSSAADASDGAADATPDSPIDAPASARCGACPTNAPVCWHVNAHDGSHIVSAECIAMPAACSATPTCDCAKGAIAASWSGDAGDAGLPRCPGNGQLYCDGSEGSLTIRCNPP